MKNIFFGAIFNKYKYIIYRGIKCYQVKFSSGGSGSNGGGGGGGGIDINGINPGPNGTDGGNSGGGHGNGHGCGGGGAGWNNGGSQTGGNGSKGFVYLEWGQPYH